MTRSVYVIGGAGTGKSTFTNTLLAQVATSVGDLENLWSLPNKKNVVTLRGHRINDDGVYLGVIRDQFPGTDGLDRASSPAGASWLRYSGILTADLPDFILGEGATLATRPFLFALAETTHLLLILLTASDDCTQARFATRGSTQDPTWVRATVSKSERLLADVAHETTCSYLRVNTEDRSEWDLAMKRALEHLEN